MSEAKYQHRIIQRIQSLVPGCLVMKNDPTWIQGIPDLLVLFGDRWVMLEVKASIDESYQPNQLHYLERLNDMSFAQMICPENEEDVLNAVQQAFGFEWQTRLFESK